MEILANGVQTESESKILEVGKIYLRGNSKAIDTSKPESLYVFGWAEETSELDIPIGELRRLSTCYEEGGKKEKIIHRILEININDCVTKETERSLNRIEEAQKSPKKKWGEKHPANLEKAEERLNTQLERVRGNKEKPPIVFIPAYASTLVVDQAVSLAVSGRRVIMLSYHESKWSDRSGSSFNKWRSATDYVPFYKAVLNQLNVEEFDAVGWSAGATIVAALASDPKIKERIRKIVLHNPGGVYEQPIRNIGVGMLSEVQWLQSETAKRIEAQKRFNNPVVPPLLPSEKNIRRQTRIMGWPLPNILLRGAKMVSSEAMIDRLEIHPSNILVIGSSNDKVFPPERLREESKDDKDDKRFEFQEALGLGHSGIGVSQLVAATITEWLDREN